MMCRIGLLSKSCAGEKHMLGSTALEVAIGLVFVYALFSLFCSALNEWLARALELRGRTLRSGLDSLLVDAKGLGAEFQKHPLIAGLAQGSDRPTYVSSHTFALALMDLAIKVNPAVGGAPGSVTVNGKTNSAAAAVIDGDAQKLLNSLLQGVTGDVAAVQQRLENWFDDSMERVSGWYKRRTQIILVFLAFAVCGVLNVDTIRIATRLQHDSSFRDSLAKQAQEAVKGATTLDAVKWQADLDKAKLPIGWESEKDPQTGKYPDDWSLSSKITGLILSVVALSLGAPFWFDVLNKLVNLRQSGIPPDEQTAK
jgi:hypothetical protein